jgi:hypothetical protein
MDIRLLLMPTLISHDKIGYICQCLEFDFVSQGSTISEVLNRFGVQLFSQFKKSIEEGFPVFDGYNKAPKFYQDQFNIGLELKMLPDDFDNYFYYSEMKEITFFPDKIPVVQEVRIV